MEEKKSRQYNTKTMNRLKCVQICLKISYEIALTKIIAVSNHNLNNDKFLKFRIFLSQIIFGGKLKVSVSVTFMSKKSLFAL